MRPSSILKEVRAQITEGLAKKIKEVKPEAVLGKACGEDIEWLKSVKVSVNILDFFTNFEPKEEIDIEGIRLFPISQIRVENEKYIPGHVITKYGYVVIASTVCGDVFAININNATPAIYLMSHNTRKFPCPETSVLIVGVRLSLVLLFASDVVNPYNTKI